MDVARTREDRSRFRAAIFVSEAIFNLRSQRLQEQSPNFFVRILQEKGLVVTRCLQALVAGSGAVVLVTLTSAAQALPASHPGDSTPTVERLSLAEALSRAASNNPELLVARTDTGIARAELIGSRLRPNPSLSFQYQTTDWRATTGAESQVNLAITQDLQLWGIRSKRVRLATLEQQRATFSVRDAERVLRREVTTSYRELLFQQERVALLDSTARLNARIARAAQLAFEQGLGSELDLRLASTAMQQSRLDYDRALREYDIEQVRFARFLGDSLNGKYQLTDSLPSTAPAVLAVRTGAGDASTAESFSIGEAETDSLVRMAMAQRPDVRAAQSALDASEVALALALAGSKPTLAIGGLLSRTRDNFTAGAPWGNGVRQALGIGMVVGLPVLSRNQGGIAQAEVAGAAAKLRVASTRLLVERDVRVAAQRVALMASQVAALRRTILPANTASLRLAEAAFARGQTSIFQVLQVQRLYAEATTALLDALRQYAVAVNDLEAAVGQPLQ